MLRVLSCIILLTSLTTAGCEKKNDMTVVAEPAESELGALYSPSNTVFRVWSPVAEGMSLHLYEDGHTAGRLSSHEMSAKDGIWELMVPGDLHKVYYTYQATIDGQQMNEVTDPYARAVGLNGLRGMVINLNSTDPDGWDEDKRPPLGNLTDAIIYELHIRDFSIHDHSGIKNKGKFLAFTENNTQSNGVSTGIAHLRELGITHLHVLPAFDFRSIDESEEGAGKYNWGYDPQNYNVPEGSYSTDPKNGEVRIREFKEMIHSLHKNGIRVVMDVVYNHTGATEDSNFNQLYPGYYYRKNKDGNFSDASACGNETASEKPMMRKFMLESVRYWVEEYHIDGFRFDLMGIHDTETMNLIAQEVKKIDPTILLYGEGWAAGDCPIPESRRAIKANAWQMPEIAVFSDEIRDGIKGHWADHHDRGFVSGKKNMEESVKFGIVAAVDHPDVDFSSVNYAKKARAKGPWQTINYVACHDDMTLYDKLDISTDQPKEEIIKMHLLANTIVLTSQGIPFLHAGADFLRTKSGDSNSYQSPDSVNWLDWPGKNKYRDIHEYYRQLIDLRKTHPVFRLTSSEDIRNRLKFTHSRDKLIAYSLEGENLSGESWRSVFVIFNGSQKVQEIELPEGTWNIALEDLRFFPEKLVFKKMEIKPATAIILYQTL